MSTPSSSATDPFKQLLWGNPKPKQDPKKPAKQLMGYTNPFEAASSTGKAMGKDAIHQLFGAGKSGDLTPGQEIHLGQKQEPPKSMENRPVMPKAAMEYGYMGEILKANERAYSEDTQKVKQEIQNLIVELKGLAASTKNLEQEIIQATGNNVVSPGVYHKNFFQHVMSIVRDARQRVDSAGTWLRAMKGKQPRGMMGGKQKKKQDYWQMAEQHGTKFTMSGERGVATQTG